MNLKLNYIAHKLLSSKYKILIHFFIIFVIYLIMDTTIISYCMNDNINIDEKPLQDLVQQMRYNENCWWQQTTDVLDRRPVPIEERPEFVLLLRSDVILMTQHLNPEHYRQMLEPYIETMVVKKALLNNEFLQLQTKNQLLSNHIEINTFYNLENIKSIEDKILDLNSNMELQFNRININMQKLENKLDNLDTTIKKLQK